LSLLLRLDRLYLEVHFQPLEHLVATLRTHGSPFCRTGHESATKSWFLPRLGSEFVVQVFGLSFLQIALSALRRKLVVWLGEKWTVMLWRELGAVVDFNLVSFMYEPSRRPMPMGS